MSDNDNNPQKKPGGPNRLILVAIVAVIIFGGWFLYSQFMNAQVMNYDTFISYLKKDRLFTDKDNPILIHDTGKISGKYRTEEQQVTAFNTYIPPIQDNGALYKLLDEHGVIYRGASDNNSMLSMILLNILPIGVLIFIIWFMFRQFQGAGNKAFTFGKSKARKFDPRDRVTFQDVAGIEEAKVELSEVVEFLKDPQKFTRIGAKIPKGVLLVGPPGTGKTLLARAVAGEAGVAFFHMSGSDFVEMFVGVGASRVRDLFEQGRKNAPCILFVDELDAVGRVRGAGYGGGHDEREQTLNQLLVEMDGFDPTIGVILIAATNRPDVLDPALLRPGRFDRQVVVDKPDVKGREEILRIHTQKVQLSKNVNFYKIARATPGFSGADLANMVNEAALLAARFNKPKVTMDDFEEARDKVMMGVARKSKVITPKDKEITAYHEAGHAIVHIFMENADDLHKVTVIPRGYAGGITFSLPKEDIHVSRLKLLDRICIAMGGRVAEEIQFGDVCTGAEGDISQSTDIARHMVSQWGMSENLGPITYGQKDEPIFIGKEIATHKDYSEKTAQLIDEEVKTIIMDQYKRAKKILTDNKEKLQLLANTLVEKETLDAEDVYTLLDLEVPEDKKTGFYNKKEQVSVEEEA